MLSQQQRKLEESHVIYNIPDVQQIFESWVAGLLSWASSNSVGRCIEAWRGIDNEFAKEGWPTRWIRGAERAEKRARQDQALPKLPHTCTFHALFSGGTGSAWPCYSVYSHSRPTFPYKYSAARGLTASPYQPGGHNIFSYVLWWRQHRSVFSTVGDGQPHTTFQMTTSRYLWGKRTSRRITIDGGILNVFP